MTNRGKHRGTRQAIARSKWKESRSIYGKLGTVAKGVISKIWRMNKYNSLNLSDRSRQWLISSNV